MQSLRDLWIVFVLILYGTFSMQAVDSNDILEEYYKNLAEDYKKLKDKDNGDCNINDIGHEDEHHWNWGTFKTLEYLSSDNNEKLRSKLKDGEYLNNLPKLRVFLARVGYLKVPGSLVFINKQTETLRLQGCGDKAQWRLQGERGVDKEFYETGKTLKMIAPNSANYIHKFTCFNLGECSHTFYVVTRLLPELPASIILRQGVALKTDLLKCAVPVCNVKKCKVGKTDKDANKRSYPPYKISWSLLKRNKDDHIFQASVLEKYLKTTPIRDQIITHDNYVEKGRKLEMNFSWSDTLRKSRDDPEDKKESYTPASDNDWINAFRENITERTEYHFSSHITIPKPYYDKHSGPYECIIEDGNGVVSTPSVFPESRDWSDYRGRTDVFVIDSQLYLIVTFGISAACVVLVLIIILVCPKKMEYDDGTLYTKDELVAPEKRHHMTETEQEPSPTPAASVSEHSSKHEHKHRSHKSMKVEDKDHAE